MHLLPTIAGGLLGLLFVAIGGLYLANLLPPPPPLPEGSPAQHFMLALAPTGYMTLVKCFEVLGGILVAVPTTRRLGLLVLLPIVVNILAYQALVADGAGVLEPPVLVVTILTLYLIWIERSAWQQLLRPRPCPA